MVAKARRQYLVPQEQEVYSNARSAVQEGTVMVVQNANYVQRDTQPIKIRAHVSNARMATRQGKEAASATLVLESLHQVTAAHVSLNAHLGKALKTRTRFS